MAEMHLGQQTKEENGEEGEGHFIQTRLKAYTLKSMMTLSQQKIPLRKILA
jgi:hypothetical protein